MKTKSILTAVLFISIFCAGSASAQRPRNLTTSKNYILSGSPTIETADETTLNPSTAVETVKYYDALGRPLQEINRGFGFSFNDIVTIHEYDAFGRKAQVRLPSVGGGNGTYVSTKSYTASANILHLNDTHPFSTISFESSPLSRPLTIYGPGMIWRQNNAKVSYTYDVTATSGEFSCIRFSVNGNRNNPSLVGSGYYADGCLTVLKTTDEDERVSYIFKDSNDRLILERRKIDGGYADTYYVYDKYGNLTYVLSPESVEAWKKGNLSLALNGYGYQYKYDERNRCVAKKLPGSEWLYYIYDKYDRLIFTQDGNLRASGMWKISLYDSFGRSTLNGLYTGDASTLGVEAIDTATESVDSGGLYGYSLPSVIPKSAVTTTEVLYYDTLSFFNNIASAYSSLEFVLREGYATTYDSRQKGLLTGRFVNYENGGGSCLQVYYYDSKGRLIQTRNNWGQTKMYAYNYSGDPVMVYESAEAGGSSGWVEYMCSYLHNGLVQSMKVRSDGGIQANFTYTYDGLNRLKQIKYGNITETYSYNVRGWNTRKQVASGTRILLDMLMGYEQPSSSSTPQYGGNISEWRWLVENGALRKYVLSYDKASRLTGAQMLQGAATNNAYSEKDITYDRNGNLLSMTRYGATSVSQNITNTYTGNWINGNSYDSNGNVVFDNHSDLYLEWNNLNLIKKVSDSNGVLVNYSYLADGTKVRALDASGDGLEYRGSLTFRRSGTSLTLEGISFPGGRFVTKSDGSLALRYHITDYLGSVRVIVDGSTGQVVETNDYYAFGGRWDGSGSLIDQSNRYRYNGKEEQTTFGTPYADYGARQYSSVDGRWLAVDPLAEKYYSISPYAFCNNNPVNFVDPDGESWGKAAKVVKKVYKAAKAGNKVSVKGILKSEALDIADNVRTLFDSDASGFEKGIAAFDLATGFGDEAKWLAKTVGVSDAIVDGGKTANAVKNRVKLRKSTKTTIIEQAPKNADGDFIDPNTGMIVPKEGPFDIGHKQGESWKKRKQEHIDRGSTRKEVIEAENDPSIYQIEDPKSNRSRRYD